MRRTVEGRSKGTGSAAGAVTMRDTLPQGRGDTGFLSVPASAQKSQAVSPRVWESPGHQPPPWALVAPREQRVLVGHTGRGPPAPCPLCATIVTCAGPGASKPGCGQGRCWGTEGNSGPCGPRLQPGLFTPAHQPWRGSGHFLAGTELSIDTKAIFVGSSGDAMGWQQGRAEDGLCCCAVFLYVHKRETTNIDVTL